MALNTAVVWEVRPGGSNNNGGGFKAGASGTDYSTQDAAQKSGTDLAIHASDNTKIQPVAAGVHANDIGNLVQITAGSGFTTGFYEITAQDGTYWTVDRATGTTGSTGGTYAMGGGLATPHKAVDNIVAGNDIMVLTGTYNQTTAIACDVAGVDATNRNRLIGYKTGSRTTALGSGMPTGTDRPLFNITSGSAEGLLITTGYWHFANLRVDGNAKAAHAFASTGIYCKFTNCLATDVNFGFVLSNSGQACYDCVVTASVVGFYNDSLVCHYAYCRAHDCDQQGFAIASSGSAWRCIADDCGSSTEDGFTLSGTIGSHLYYCVAYKSGRHGIYINGANTPDNVAVIGCILAENGAAGVGYGVAASTDISNMSGTFIDYNAFYNGATQDAARNNAPTGPNDVTLSGDPFTAAASDDFTLNNTAGAGASCREAGWPGELAIGALEPAGSGGSGGGPLVRGRLALR